GGVLCPPLGERPRRLTLEVEYDPGTLRTLRLPRPQHLPEMIVPVCAGLHRAVRGEKTKILHPLAKIRSITNDAGELVLDTRREGARHHVEAATQILQHGRRLPLNPLDPSLNVLIGDRLGS